MEKTNKIPENKISSILSGKNKILNDKKGQMSLELLLVSLIAILILSTFTIPIAKLAIDYTSDGSKSLEIKSEISKIATGLDSVYANGVGAKKSIAIEVPEDLTIKFSNNTKSEGLATVKHVLSDGKLKEIQVIYSYPHLNGELQLSEGYNLVIVEWPIDSEEIIVRKSI